MDLSMEKWAQVGFGSILEKLDKTPKWDMERFQRLCDYYKQNHSNGYCDPKGTDGFKMLRKLYEMVKPCADQILNTPETKRKSYYLGKWDYDLRWDMFRIVERYKYHIEPIEDVILEVATTPTAAMLQNDAPGAQPLPSVQATEKDNAPDFSCMESFAPTNELDLSALYRYLINEGVIKDIDERLFTDCITHANMNELFGHGIRSKLKCVVQHLKGKFAPKWFDVVCANLGLTKQQMGKFNLGDPKKRKEFERNLPI